LKRVYEESNKIYRYLQELYELRRNVPNPDLGFLRVFDVALFFLEPVFPEVTEYFKLRVEEVKRRVQKGEFIIPPEKTEIRYLIGYILDVYYLPPVLVAREDIRCDVSHVLYIVRLGWDRGYQ